MLHITRSGVTFSGSSQDLECLRREFDQHHCLHFSRLLDAELLDLVSQGAERANFYTNPHKDGDREFALELCMRENAITSLLFFLMNNPRLFELIQQITGCERIGCFFGRVYRMISGCGHYDEWHSDVTLEEGRMITLSLNLSRQAYEGGVTQIREKKTGRIVHEVANTGYGDAIIFRIADFLEHRVMEVTGSVPKTAFAGWFRERPNFLQFLKEQVTPPV